MSRIRGLEQLFNLEKKNMKSKEDCVVAALHCLLINDNFGLVGVGENWQEVNPSTTELLPSEWNTDQNAYQLRYVSKDFKNRILLKITKMEHILQVDVVRNEDAAASMSVPVDNYIENNYTEYSTAYKDLSTLCESFRKDVMEKLQDPEKEKKPSPGTCKTPAPPRSPPSEKDLDQEDPYGGGNPRFPRVGGSDLYPYGTGGGMIMDPSNMGIPVRPPLQDFGVGRPGGLPRGAVPPGARFDPITPPNPPGRVDPDPDHIKPPDAPDKTN